MEEKKKFVYPEMIIVSFGEQDIITASGDNYDPYDPDKDYWED